MFVGIALCAIFGVLQVVREKKKAKLKEEQEHLEQIAVSDVELEQNGENITADETADETAESEKAEVASEENAIEEAEKKPNKLPKIRNRLTDNQNLYEIRRAIVGFCFACAVGEFAFYSCYYHLLVI